MSCNFVLKPQINEKKEAVEKVKAKMSKKRERSIKRRGKDDNREIRILQDYRSKA